MSLLSGLFAKFGRPHSARDLSTGTRALLDDFIAENLERKRSYDPLIYSGAGKKLLALPDEERLELVICLMADASDIQRQSASAGNEDELRTCSLSRAP